MQTSILGETGSQIPLRAIVEIYGGELVIFPLADSDIERETILDALRNFYNKSDSQPQ